MGDLELVKASRCKGDSSGKEGQGIKGYLVRSYHGIGATAGGG